MTMIEIPTVDQLELDGGRVFYRVDYNVPMENGGIADTTRIDGTLATINMLRERGARIVIASHFGRPKGERVAKDSLAPVHLKLQEILGRAVQWSDDCVGDEAERKAAALKPGEILLLENLRYHRGEEKNDRAFAAELRKLADFYVNDAFGASHRAHASIVALPELFPPANVAAGLLLSKELEFLQKVTNVTDRPFVAILGGAKIAGKIEALETMAKIADVVLIGGGMANTFLHARGVALGKSLLDPDSLAVAKRILESRQAEIVLPVDLVAADSLSNPHKVELVDVTERFPDELMALDIGPKTVALYAARLEEARVIFWNGPMGVFEKEEFANGTRAIAKAVADAAAVSIVGGGESVDAVKSSGFASQISHISTGGGASLEFVSGIELPGIKVLQSRRDAAGN